MLTKLYRKHISKETRQKIYDLFLGDVLLQYRTLKDSFKQLSYRLYYTINSPKNELEKTKFDWSRKPNSPYPYLWEKDYLAQDYPIYTDKEQGLNYVLHNEKRLYFKRSQSNITKEIYQDLLIEQDDRSAHRYVESYEDLKGKNLLDIGCAEAIFTLDTIEHIQHAYLFECDEEWIEALEATFAPWKDKVSIIRRYVNDFTDENNITIDDFVSQSNIDNLYIKMDIEGFERKALAGAKQTFASDKNIEGSICLYHLADDKEVIQDFLHQKNCRTSVVPGYLYYAKCFREAIIRFKSTR